MIKFSKSDNSTIKRIAFWGAFISLALVITAGSYVNADSESKVDVQIKGSIEYDFANEILIQVNQERKKAGLLPLTMNEGLMESANIRAQECVLRYSHRRPVSDEWTSLIHGFKHAGENLAIGYIDAKSVVKAWMNSPIHKANILGSDYKSIGIGVFKYTNQITGETVYTCAQHFNSSQLDKVQKSGHEDSIYAVTVDTSVYPLNLNLQVLDHEVSQELALYPGQEVKTILRIKADEIYGQKYITAEWNTLEWSIANTQIAGITNGGIITAKKIGQTTMEAISADNNYKLAFNINVRKPITSVITDEVQPQPYTGDFIEPEIEVFDGKEKLVKGEDYELRYSDNIYPGNGKIHVLGKGDYAGDHVIYFSVYDESTVIKEGIIKKFLRLIGFD